MCVSSLSRQGRTALSRCVAFSLCPQMGDTPLHCACSSDRPKRDLLKEVYAFWQDAATWKNQEGKAPLHYICENGEATKELVQCVYAFDKTAAAKKDKARQPRSPRSHAHAGCDP